MACHTAVIQSTLYKAVPIKTYQREGGPSSNMSLGRSLWLLAVLLATALADDGEVPKDLNTSGETSKEDVSEQQASKSGAIFSDEETIAESHAAVYQSNDMAQNYLQKFESKSMTDPMSYLSYPVTGPSTAPVQNLGSVKSNSQFSSNYENIMMSDAVIKETNNYPLSSLMGEDSYARRIPPSDYVLLHTISGAENIITCTREGDLHNFWSPVHKCLVCACIRIQGILKPVCASCNGCMAPGKIPRFPAETPTRNYPGVTIVPEVDEIVTCSPLPSGTPFQNPLHPCQVCVCTESVNALGKPDVHIECQQNSQCVLPDNVPNLPNIPDTISPVPLPLCEKFPHNVQFPHPVEECKVCKCIVHTSALGRKEQHILCRPDPRCPSPSIPELTGPPPRLYPGIKIPGIPEVTTIPAYPNTIPYEPVTQETPMFPDVMNPREPWTPGALTTVPSVPRGPLPGPSPHESCKPFIPNQPFQHPWDECKTCVCTEATNIDRVTVEINCFTKKSCCIEPPLELGQTGLPSTVLPTIQQQPGKVQIVDQLCEYKSFGSEFTHPTDPCKICICELSGYLVTPVCKRSLSPECLTPPIYPNIPTHTEAPLLNNHNSYAINKNQLYHNQMYQNHYENQMYQNKKINSPYRDSSEPPWNPGYRGNTGIRYNGIKGQGYYGNQRLVGPNMGPNGYQYNKGRQTNWYNPAMDGRGYKSGVSPELLMGYKGVNVNPGYGYKVPFGYPGSSYGSVAMADRNRLATVAHADASVKTHSTRVRTKSGNPDEYEPSDEEE